LFQKMKTAFQSDELDALVEQVMGWNLQTDENILRMLIDSDFERVACDFCHLFP